MRSRYFPAAKLSLTSGTLVRVGDDPARAGGASFHKILFRQIQAFHQVVVSRVVEERVVRTHRKPNGQLLITRLKFLFQPNKSLILFTQADANHSNPRGLHVGLLGPFLQLAEDLPRFAFLARDRVGVSQGCLLYTSDAADE